MPDAIGFEEARKLEEAHFHDTRERDRHMLSRREYEKKYSNKKWYAATDQSRRFLDAWIASHAKGLTVLDYCCGLGAMSLRFAQAGATVYGIDISPESVATAKQRLVAEGLGDSGHFEVMDAEHLTFEAGKFDVIVCAGVLHHLDATRAFQELARVVKPSGHIIAIEALGYNPVIRAYRKLTPHLRTAWEIDHILTRKELKVARKHFRRLDVNYFHLFSVAATPLRNTRLFQPVLRLLNAIDRVVLKIPGLQLMAWQMIFVLEQPVKRS